MENDDRPVGRALTRRELVGLFGASVGAAATLEAVRRGLASSAAAGELPATAALAAQDCIAQPQQTEGPYFVDEHLHRPDIRTDPATGQASAGAPLELRLVVSTVTAAGACAPLAGAQVDIWHCDALGVYSDVLDRSSDTIGRKFLRGHQVTDGAGVVRFTTVYPGWYGGRAVHIHFKVRRPADDGRLDEFTSQLYFDDALTDRVHAAAPYASKKGQRLLNTRDMIFREGGTRLILPVVENASGYEATFRIAILNTGSQAASSSRATRRSRRPTRRAA